MDDGHALGRGEEAENLARLRAELARRGVDGFLVPRDRRVSRRIRPRFGAAPRLADRLHRLGRPRRRFAAESRDFRRWPLHPSGPGRSRWPALRAPPYQRPAGRALDRREPASRARPSATIRGCTPWARWRAIAPPPKRPAASCVALDEQPRRCRVARPPGAAAGAGGAAGAALCRRDRRGQARPDRRRLGRRRRRRRADRARFDRLAAQYPRRRRAAYAAAAELRVSIATRPSISSSIAAS